MSNLVNIVMPIFQGKKEVVVGSKVSQAENEAFLAICEKEDRSMSYVIRELALRGLAQYMRDGQLKLTAEDEKAISSPEKSNRQKLSRDKIFKEASDDDYTLQASRQDDE